MKKILITALPKSIPAPTEVLGRLVGVALETLRIEGKKAVVSATDIALAMLDRTDKDKDSVSVSEDWIAARFFSGRINDEIALPFDVCRPIIE